MGTLPITATLAKSQADANRMARSMEQSVNFASGGATLEAQDETRAAGYVIYVYNVLPKEHPTDHPKFPGLRIPACPTHEKFSVITLPPFTNERFCRPGTNDFYYKKMDGRRDATSLLNPAAYPGTEWEKQQAKWQSLDQIGNNLNSWGVFWSLTPPEDVEHLDVELKIFREIAMSTMEGLVKEGEKLAAENRLRDISPNMHFAMDQLGKQAPWHMSMHHMVSCPNCGGSIKEGIAYHKNDFGDRCIIDMARYIKLFPTSPEAIALRAEPQSDDEPPATPKRKKTA